MSRFRLLFHLVILPAVILGLTACGSKSSPPGPSVNVQSPPPNVQEPGPAFQPAPAVPERTPSVRDPLMEQGAKFMAVVMQYKQRLEKDPKDKDALMFLGNANYDINRFGQAKDYYKRYLEIDPKHAAVRTDLATSYYKVRDVDSAVRELKTVVAQVPDHEAALYNLGLILWQDKHDNPGAVQAWEVLLKAHPNHPKAAEVRKQIAEMKKKS
ncbi:MAG: tetratricopeptide repeat protein [Nitrospirae bacterium]|nr:tetratricopeptide repeat protein [Nitrospirota bacterium]